MAESLLFSTATGAMESIGSQIAKPGGAYASQMIQLFCSAEGELRSLKKTVKTIRAVLMDAEKKQCHDEQVKLRLEGLKDVLYDAQDLFDDISTEDLRRQAMAGNKMMKEVCLFFSKSNQLAHRFNVANQIWQLRKKLDELAYNNNNFNFKLLPIEEKMATGRPRKPQIFAPGTKIIGREEDKKKIKQILFDSSSRNTLSVVSIVGKGGLGKTALARLVYEDGEVNGHFELKMWVCVSDVFDVDLIFKEILKYVKSDCRGHDDDEMKKLLHDLENKPSDQLPSLLHEILSRKKYLLVLDDLWNEARHKWLELEKWLEGGLPGSKILVTTRIHKVAKVMDKKSVIHDLHGLSEDKSWNLFKEMAFGDGLESLDPELEKLGRDIVNKCAGIPLAIRTIGGLLYSVKKDGWLRYKAREFPEIPEIDKVDDGIMQVLNFSYDHLPTCLKHCFVYCSLFPKDYVYRKREMIQLWVAQGFIESHSREDDLEEVANNYLEELLGRSFLDVEYVHDTGEVIRFKMHDLMHDLAQKVGGGECKTINFRGGDNDERIRHAFISEISTEEKMVSLLKTSKLWTFICNSSSLNSSKVLSECSYCRALVLDNTNIPLPPSSFKKLKHLRFLRIFGNQSMQSLPDSIMDLVNLQILELRNCRNLKTFPRDLRKLVNLRWLSIEDCKSLSHLPPLSELPSLKTLSLSMLPTLEFLQQTSDLEQSNTTRPFFPTLERLTLIHCTNLKGWLGRRQLIGADKKHRPDNSRSSFQKLRFVEIIGCPHLNDVAPFPQVQELDIDGTKMLANPNCPSEAAMGSTFTPFSQLKDLRLGGRDLEPSKLETLFQLASNLESLYLHRCKLRSLSGMQHLSSLQKLAIEGVEGFDLLCEEDEHGIRWRSLTKLRVLEIFNSWALTALPEGIQHVKTLQSLEISYHWNLESLPEWIGNFSSLEKLALIDCPKLKRLPLEMRNLTRLTELRIRNCNALKEWCLTDGRKDWLEIARVPVTV